MNKIKENKNIKYFLIILFFYFNIKTDPQFTNLSSPYEWIFDSARFFLYPENEDKGLKIGFLQEFSLKMQGYLADDSDLTFNPFKEKNYCNKINPIMFLQNEENVMNIFFGNDANSEIGKFLQDYNFYNGQGAYKNISAKGDLSFNGSFFSLEKWLTENIRLGFYIPYYFFKIKNLDYSIKTDAGFFEYFLNDIKKEFKKNNLIVEDYSKNGFGDSNIIISWQDSFAEKRDFINGITVALRTGLHLPTGTYFDKKTPFFKIPFGYDVLWGILFGGSFEADFGKYFSLGLSADLETFFGNIKERKIKTDIRQGDLFLIKKNYSFVDPGFKEKYTIYGSLHDLQRVYLGTFAYQYNKQNESDIIICSTENSSFIASINEILESWTTHHLLLNLQTHRSTNNFDYLIGIFGKLGFNGQRSIVANTIGFNLSFDF